MSIEGLGEKFRQARLARKLTLAEAARITKIRPSRLEEIEADDFSNFPSLAYAKGFLLIYGKFLDVDVSSYLEAFETSNAVTVDGYSYLQENPAPRPTPAVIRAPKHKTSLLPLLIGIVVLVVGFSLMKLILDISRIAPPRKNVATQPSPAPSVSSGPIVAPRALPVESTAAPAKSPIAEVTATPTATPAPMVTSSTPAPTPLASASEPEVRRAEPVHPEDLVRAGLKTNTGEPAAGAKRLEVRPVRKTFVRVVVEKDGRRQVYEQWVSPEDRPLLFEGERFTVHALEPDSVQLRKNGKRISEDDADVTTD
jgi:cytoskeleton protein RodZ